MNSGLSKYEEMYVSDDWGGKLSKSDSKYALKELSDLP
jgi:hypothetical protein